MDAIDVMSTWRFTDEYDKDDSPASPGDEFVVTGVYIDEDGEAQLTVKHSYRDYEVLISADDLRYHMAQGTVERTNTSHEAWKARQ